MGQGSVAALSPAQLEVRDSHATTQQRCNSIALPPPPQLNALLLLPTPPLPAPCPPDCWTQFAPQSRQWGPTSRAVSTAKGFGDQPAARPNALKADMDPRDEGGPTWPGLMNEPGRWVSHVSPNRLVVCPTGKKNPRACVGVAGHRFAAPRPLPPCWAARRPGGRSCWRRSACPSPSGPRPRTRRCPPACGTRRPWADPGWGPSRR